jgi:hypothetical protein
MSHFTGARRTLQFPSRLSYQNTRTGELFDLIPDLCFVLSHIPFGE